MRTENNETLGGIIELQSVANRKNRKHSVESGNRAGRRPPSPSSLQYCLSTALARTLLVVRRIPPAGQIFVPEVQQNDNDW